MHRKNCILSSFAAEFKRRRMKLRKHENQKEKDDEKGKSQFHLSVSGAHT